MIRAAFARPFVARRRSNSRSAPQTPPQSDPINASRTACTEAPVDLGKAARFGARTLERAGAPVGARRDQLTRRARTRERVCRTGGLRSAPTPSAAITAGREIGASEPSETPGRLAGGSTGAMSTVRSGLVIGGAAAGTSTGVGGVDSASPATTGAAVLATSAVCCCGTGEAGAMGSSGGESAGIDGALASTGAVTDCAGVELATSAAGTTGAVASVAGSATGSAAAIGGSTAGAVAAEAASTAGVSIVGSASGSPTGAGSGRTCGGRTVSGSTYPCGSLVTRTPKYTYGCAPSDAPTVPTTVTPSTAVASRLTAIAPRCSSVAVYPNGV